MIDDLPTWALLATHLLTGGGGGVIAAYVTSRGSAREGSASILEAADGRIELAFQQLEAEIDRLKRERANCNEKIDELRDALDEERQKRRQLRETIDVMVEHIESAGDSLPEEIAG